MRYETLAVAYRDLEQVSSRLGLIDRLAELLRQTPAGLLPRVVYLCLGEIAPAFAGVDIGLADKMVTRALADHTGVPLDDVRAVLRETGDLGLTAEQLLARSGRDRPPTLEVGVVFETLHQIAAAAGPGSQGRKLALFGGLLERATPLEARYLARTVTHTLRLGVGYPTILDALALVHAGSRDRRPVLERAYNICSDLGLVAATLVHGGLEAVEAIQVRPGNPVRPMLAQRMRSAAELLAKLGGSCGAEYKYDGVRVQAHRTADGLLELFTRRLERVADQFPDVVGVLGEGLGPRQVILEGEVVAADPVSGELRPFQEVIHRRRKHGITEAIDEWPVSLYCFDLLYADGEDLTRLPYPQRRARLEAALTTGPRLHLTTAAEIDDPETLELFFEQAIADGCEGLLCKSLSPTAGYQAGVRGWLWIKLKRDYRTELAALPRRLAPLARPDQPARVDARMVPDVWFEPGLVVEVLGAELTLSPIHTAAWGMLKEDAGLALRFPRFTGHYRDDKAPQDATTVPELLDLSHLAHPTPAG